MVLLLTCSAVKCLAALLDSACCCLAACVCVCVCDKCHVHSFVFRYSASLGKPPAQVVPNALSLLHATSRRYMASALHQVDAFSILYMTSG